MDIRDKRYEELVKKVESLDVDPVRLPIVMRWLEAFYELGLAIGKEERGKIMGVIDKLIEEKEQARKKYNVYSLDEALQISIGVLSELKKRTEVK